MDALAHIAAVVEDDAEQRPMTDAEHHAVFGWGWDDPNKTEVDQ